MNETVNNLRQHLPQMLLLTMDKQIGRIGVMRAFEKSPGDVILFGFTQTYKITELILNAVGTISDGTAVT